MMKIRSISQFGLVLGVLAAGSAVSSAAIECPCEIPPMGTVKTKTTTPMPGGGSLKVVCTNESWLGNFESFYCTPDGEMHKIGTCIYQCGWNTFRYTVDPVTGKVCSIIHYNFDRREQDNPNHQLKVYVYNAKNGTTTTYCYKLNDDGTYTPYGTPTCVPAGETHPIHESEIDLPKFAVSIGAFVAAVAEPQVWVQPTVVVANAVTGSRTLSVDSDGVDIVFDAGDVIELNAPASMVTSLHPSFTVLPGDDDHSATLMVTEDLLFSGVVPIARISSAMGREPIALAAVSATDDELHEMLDAIECGDVAFDINPYVDLRLDADMMIEASPIVADVNGDSKVDGSDLATLLACYGTSNEVGDVDGDGLVDTHDLVSLLSAWGAEDEQVSD